MAHEYGAVNEDRETGLVGSSPDGTETRRVVVNDDGKVEVEANLEVSDIQIGAVEIKDGSSDIRTKVEAHPLSGDNELLVNLKNHVSTGNSTATPLAADATFTGVWEDVSQYQIIQVMVYTDQASADDGVIIEYSSDGTNVDNTDTFEMNSIGTECFRSHRNAQYIRVKYTNGGTLQGAFRLQTIYDRTGAIHSSSRLKEDITEDDDASLVKAVMSVQTYETNVYKNVDVQNPLPTDGDSVYGKDLCITCCDNGDFSGDTTDYFDNLLTTNVNTTATNPKVIKIWFRRSVYTNTIGLGCHDLTKDFSNVEIEFLGSGEVVRCTYDDSANNTKYNTKLYKCLEPVACNGINIKFHTADEVGLSNITIRKEVMVVARLQAAKPNGEIAEIQATSGGNLKISLEEFENAISCNSNTQLNATLFKSDGTELALDSNGIVSIKKDKASTATNTAVSVAVTSTTVLAVNANRKQAIIINDSDEEIYLKFGATAVLNSGLRLNAYGGTLVEEVYTGIVTGISTSGSKTVTVIET